MGVIERQIRRRRSYVTRRLLWETAVSRTSDLNHPITFCANQKRISPHSNLSLSDYGITYFFCVGDDCSFMAFPYHAIQ